MSKNFPKLVRRTPLTGPPGASGQSNPLFIGRGAAEGGRELYLSTLLTMALSRLLFEIHK